MRIVVNQSSNHINFIIFHFLNDIFRFRSQVDNFFVVKYFSKRMFIKVHLQIEKIYFGNETSIEINIHPSLRNLDVSLVLLSTSPQGKLNGTELDSQLFD